MNNEVIKKKQTNHHGLIHCITWKVIGLLPSYIDKNTVLSQSNLNLTLQHLVVGYYLSCGRISTINQSYIA
jgi:hypothetical protein